MLVCAALVPLIWRDGTRRSDATCADGDAELCERRGQLAPDRARCLTCARSRLLILVANITTSLAGWQCKALAKFFIPQKDVLAAFFGDFYFYAGIAGFVVQLAVTGRLLRTVRPSMSVAFCAVAPSVERHGNNWNLGRTMPLGPFWNWTRRT